VEEQGDYVVLVDADDRHIDIEDKMRAHREGRLHRAFSVFVFNDAGEMLLQQRAFSKYHSGGLWSNACCSHPRPGESPAEGARRRLTEEMGLVCEPQHLFAFVYRADVGNGLTEHEYDHVFIARTNDTPVPDEREIAAWRWVRVDRVRHELATTPETYTAWFRPAFDALMARGALADAGH
jgi:isopentenyl-diphosphate delta-isomerase